MSPPPPLSFMLSLLASPPFEQHQQQLMSSPISTIPIIQHLLTTTSNNIITNINTHASTTTNGTSTTSSTLSSYIYLNHLDPYILSGVSIGIELLFIPICLGLITFIGIFMSRKDIRNVMAKNQKILLSLVIILLLMQVIGLIFRGVFDSLSIDIVYNILHTIHTQQGSEAARLAYSTMNSTTISAHHAGITDSQIIALYLMGSFEILTQIQNHSLILLIMLFITRVFLKTVAMATTGKVSTKIKLIHYLVNVVGGLAVVVMFGVILALAVIYFIVKIRITMDFQIYLFVMVYIIYVVTVLFLGLISNMVGWAVINVIRKRSSKLNKQTNQQSLKKVVILQVGINISALIQLFSGIFVAISSELVYLKLAYYFFNNVGIVVFAMLVFSLYHPLFTGAVKELNEMKNEKSLHSSIGSGNDSSRLDHAKAELSEKSVSVGGSKSEKRRSGAAVQPIVSTTVNSPTTTNNHGDDIGSGAVMVEMEDEGVINSIV